MASIRRFNEIIAQLFYVNWILLVFFVFFFYCVATTKDQCSGRGSLLLYETDKATTLRNHSWPKQPKFNQSQTPA